MLVAFFASKGQAFLDESTDSSVSVPYELYTVSRLTRQHITSIVILFLEVLSECFQASEARVLRSFSFDAAKPMGYVVEDDCSYSIILLEFAEGFLLQPYQCSMLSLVLTPNKNISSFTSNGIITVFYLVLP